MQTAKGREERFVNYACVFTETRTPSNTGTNHCARALTHSLTHTHTLSLFLSLSLLSMLPQQSTGAGLVMTSQHTAQPTAHSPQPTAHRSMRVCTAVQKQWHRTVARAGVQLHLRALP